MILIVESFDALVARGNHPVVRVVVLPTIPNGGEDGVMRQQPRGVKMKEVRFHMSACLILIFSDVTFGFAVLFQIFGR